jgi:hypothetical protein
MRFCVASPVAALPLGKKAVVKFKPEKISVLLAGI